MRRSSRFGLVGLLLALDQLSKQLLQDAHAPLIPGLIRLSGTRNTGAAFGLLGGSPWLLAGVSLVVAGLVALYLWRAQPQGLYGLGLTLVLAGAIGNLIDRIARGYVIDFLEFTFTRFAVFNLADVCITLGCALATLGVLLHKEAPRG